MNIINLFFILFPLFFFASCSVNIISPGLSSIYRLHPVGGIRFQEAVFYGVGDYDYSAFFVEPENIQPILTDPSNVLSPSESADTLSSSLDLSKNNRVILFEVCYDKNKDQENRIKKDFDQYVYKLNGGLPILSFPYLYLYSFIERSGRRRKRNPYFVRDQPPNHNKIVQTGSDFLACFRNLIFFPISIEKKGLNEFYIYTPRQSPLWFHYEFDGEFKKFWNEPSEIRVK